MNTYYNQAQHQLAHRQVCHDDHCHNVDEIVLDRVVDAFAHGFAMAMLIVAVVFLTVSVMRTAWRWRSRHEHARDVARLVEARPEAAPTPADFAELIESVDAFTSTVEKIRDDVRATGDRIMPAEELAKLVAAETLDAFTADDHGDACGGDNG